MLGDVVTITASAQARGLGDSGFRRGRFCRLIGSYTVATQNRRPTHLAGEQGVVTVVCVRCWYVALDRFITIAATKRPFLCRADYATIRRSLDLAASSSLPLTKRARLKACSRVGTRHSSELSYGCRQEGGTASDP